MGWKECDPTKYPNGATFAQAMEQSLGAVDALVKAAKGSKEFGAKEIMAVGVLEDFAAGVRSAGEACEESCLRMLEYISKAHKKLGAPGDWGYGYPEGDALQWLYASTRLLNAVTHPAVAQP